MVTEGDERMHFEHRVLLEVPFILNVPDGKYNVTLPGGVKRVLIIHNGYYAASDDAFEYASGKVYGLKHSLPSALPNSADVSVVKLRTVVEMRLDKVVDENDAVQPTESDLINEVSRELIKVRATNGSSDALTAKAKAILATHPTEHREDLRRTCQRRLTANQLFPPTLADGFLAAVNAFVRQYMVAMEDFFVEEVALHQVAGTTMGGIVQHTQCDGIVVASVTTVGLIAPIMRSQWFTHPKPKLDALKAALETGLPPNAVELLGVRARHLVERGAHRSAIIEAAAALETAIARRLIASIVSNGASEAQALQFLKGNQRFSERGKTHFKAIVGKSLAEHDPMLWNRVVVHRDNLRHKIAHSDLEPSAEDTKSVVADFLTMAEIAQTVR